MILNLAQNMKVSLCAAMDAVIYTLLIIQLQIHDQHGRIDVYSQAYCYIEAEVHPPPVLQAFCHS